MLGWVREKPARPGRYLRNNPPARGVVRADIVEGRDGKLWLASGNIDDPKMPLVENLSDRWWWFGPIPDPPWDDG
jgi:hypothetical protein